MRYLLGIDIGTTSLKAAVFDEYGNMYSSVTKDYTLIVAGETVELPAEKYFELTLEAYKEVTKDITVSAMAIDTQCETLILADEAGTPVYNAVVWLDNRAARQAEEIKAHFGNRRVYEVTGQPEITATWPASKILWFKENKPELLKKAKKIFLLEDYILFRLTGKFVTEKTLQSSTVYYDISADCWWKEMLDFIGIDEGMLPEICGCGERIGEYEGVPVVTGAMDQVAGAIGAGVVDSSAVSEMTGTTMAVFATAEAIPPYNPDSVIPCHKNFDGGFCLLSWTPTAGIALKWFKNALCEDFDFKQLDEAAAGVEPGSNGLIFLPYLCGSTMPRYNPDARGAFVGLTMEHTRGHFVRSILESVAAMLKENLDYLGVKAVEIRSTGGGAGSPLWCKIKADMTGRQISVLQNSETACLGAAVLAGAGIGIYGDIPAACRSIVKIKKTYLPSGTDYTRYYNAFIAAEDKSFN